MNTTNLSKRGNEMNYTLKMNWVAFLCVHNFATNNGYIKPFAEFVYGFINGRDVMTTFMEFIKT